MDARPDQTTMTAFAREVDAIAGEKVGCAGQRLDGWQPGTELA